MTTHTLSRRTFLKGLSAGALGAGMLGTGLALPRAARAQTGAPAEGALGFYRFRIGALEATVMQDGVSQLDPALFGGGAPEGAVDEVLAEANLPAPLNVTFNLLLLRTADTIALVDTGNGIGANGRLFPTLAALGVSPEDVNHVVISHLHPDHINGVLIDDVPAFPNATHHFPQVEWDFVQTAPTGTPLDDILNLTAATFAPVEAAGQLVFYADEQEVIPGVQAIAAPGHTPGHMAYLISADGQSVMATMDAANHHVLALQHPEWGFAFDADPALATETRRAIFGRAADEQLAIFAYHFPFPGTGYIDREGEGFRFTPAML
jgi:glyoxylase-like metal-dependent hydrolase (beta-lactamase superfamily II)